MDDPKTKKPDDARQTLRDDDIVTDSSESDRRSAIARIGLGVLGAVGAVIGLNPSVAEAQSCSDSDGGPYGDRAGYGRRCRVYYQPQPVYYPPPQQAYPPQYVPPPPQQVYVPPAQGCTDSDGGPYADAGGRGRRCGGPAYYYRPRRSCTDSDSGSYADAAGRGRGC